MKNLALCTSVMLAGAASAQMPEGPPHSTPVNGPPLAVSIEAAQSAIAACKALNYPVGVAIVDDRGSVLVNVSGDGAAWVASNGARREAVLSAQKKIEGDDLAKRYESDKAFAADIDKHPDWLAHPGARLIKVGDRLLGAVAVEGNPHDVPKNSACVKVALDHLLARMK